MNTIIKKKCWKNVYAIIKSNYGPYNRLVCGGSYFVYRVYHTWRRFRSFVRIMLATRGYVGITYEPRMERACWPLLGGLNALTSHQVQKYQQ